MGAAHRWQIEPFPGVVAGAPNLHGKRITELRVRVPGTGSEETPVWRMQPNRSAKEQRVRSGWRSYAAGFLGLLAAVVTVVMISLGKRGLR